MVSTVLSAAGDFSEVRNALVQQLDPDLVEAVLEEAVQENPAAEFIVGSALEDENRLGDAINWYRLAAAQNYSPARERLQRLGHRIQ